MKRDPETGRKSVACRGAERKLAQWNERGLDPFDEARRDRLGGIGGYGRPDFGEVGLGRVA